MVLCQSVALTINEIVFATWGLTIFTTAESHPSAKSALGWSTHPELLLRNSLFMEASRGKRWTQGPSTPQIIAFAMTFSGRDDSVGWSYVRALR